MSDALHFIRRVRRPLVVVDVHPDERLTAEKAVLSSQVDKLVCENGQLKQEIDRLTAELAARGKGCCSHETKAPSVGSNDFAKE